MNKLNKIIYSILFLLIFIFIIIFVYDNVRVKEYIKEYDYFNEITIIKIWTNNNKHATKLFKDIDNIYKKNSNLSIENKEEYLNDVIKKYLDNNNVKKYYINMNNTIILNGKFKVGLPDPYDELNILKIINAENKCISTIIDEYNSITVISNKNCQSLGLTLIQKDINVGLDIVNNMNDVEAIWYYNKKYTKSNNFMRFE